MLHCSTEYSFFVTLHYTALCYAPIYSGIEIFTPSLHFIYTLYLALGYISSKALLSIALNQ